VRYTTSSSGNSQAKDNNTDVKALAIRKHHLEPQASRIPGGSQPLTGKRKTKLFANCRL